MTTTMTRFDDVSPQTFNNQSETGKSSFPVTNRPTIKDEKRLSCPYTNEVTQNKEHSSIIGEHVSKAKHDSPQRSLSPEFLLGASKKTGQEPKATEGPAQVAKTITCVYCNEKFANKKAQELHIATVHGDAGTKLYDCSTCEKRFTHRSSRDIHLRVHSGLRPYECDYCKKRFRVSSHLRDHVRTHTGERPFKCEVCGRGFKQSSDMKKHRKTHFKTMPIQPVDNPEGAATSYMIVRPEETATAADQSSNALKSPTDQRQNLKLVIKRERKPSDIKLPITADNTKTVPGNNIVSSNHAQPGNKSSGDSTQYVELNTKTLPTSNIETNTNRAPNGHSDENAIRSTKEPKTSPVKVALKRKAGPKSHEKNGYKSITPYPSMASGFGQIYTSTGNDNLSRPDPPITTSQKSMESYNSANQTGNPQIQQTQYENRLSYDNQMSNPQDQQAQYGNRLSYEKKAGNPQNQQTQYENRLSYDNQMGNPQNQQAQYGNGLSYDNQLGNPQNQQAQYGNGLSRDSKAGNPRNQQTQHENRLSYDNQVGNPQGQQAQYENGLSYDNRTTMQMQSQNGAHGEDEVFWQPETKLIKTEKLSPNPHEQSPCMVGRMQPAYGHEAPTYNHEQPTSSHDKPTRGHEQPIHGHELSTCDHEQPTGSHESMPYTHDRPTESNDATMNADEEQTYIDDVAMTTNEELANNHVNSSVAKQRADVSVYTKTRTLANTSTVVTEIPEDNADFVPEDNEVVPNNLTSPTEVIPRKPMVVKLRRDKTGGVVKVSGPGLSVRMIKPKDQEDAQFAFSEKASENLEEPTANKRGKNNKTFKCTICSKVFARATLLRQHMVLHQGNKRFRFKCNYCGRAFRHRSHLRDHERIHTGERPFKCSFCPKAFKQSSDHRKHENLHTGTTRYRCEKCSLDFKRCDALKRHATMHSEGEVTLLKCDKCRSLLATADGHTSHVCLSKPFRYRCQICPERFTDANDLRRHCYQLHGEQSTVSCLKCEFCKLEFENLEQLDKHLGTHRLEKTHTCRTCDQSFSLLNQLVEHVKSHNTAPGAGDYPPGIAPSPVSQTEPSRAEQITTNAQRKEFSQAMEIPRNMMPTSRVSLNPYKPHRPKYDFIPSKYQSLTPTNSIYGQLAVGNWSRPRNVYVPIRPKGAVNDVNPPRQDEVAPRDNPIASRNTTESSEINPTSYRRNTKSSAMNPTSSESGSIATRPSTIAKTMNAYPQTSPTTIVDECSTTSFSTYHAIALSRNAFRGMGGCYQNEPSASKTEPNTSQNKPITNNSIPAVETAHLAVRNNIDADSSEIYRSPKEIRRNTEQSQIDSSEKSEIDPEEIRRYYEETRMQSEQIRTNPGEIRRYADEMRRSSQEVRYNSDATRRNYESERMGPIHTRENTVISEEHIADKRLSNESANSHRSQGQFPETQHGQPVVNRKYTCLNCRLEFYHENSLVDHVCDILSETLYCCLVCEQDFDKYEDIQVHMRTHWKPVVHFKCTLCGHRMRSEELLKEHNLKHLEEAREEHREGYGHDEVFATTGDKDGYHRITNGNARDDPNDPPETFLSPPGSAKSVTSPVICSVSGNIITKKTTHVSERGYKERRSSNKETEVSSNTSIELANHNALSLRDEVIPRSSHNIPYYEARKQASSGYLPAIVVSAMHAAMENSGRYPVPNTFLYPPTMSRSGYTVKHH